MVSSLEEASAQDEYFNKKAIHDVAFGGIHICMVLTGKLASENQTGAPKAPQACPR